MHRRIGAAAALAASLATGCGSSSPAPAASGASGASAESGSSAGSAGGGATGASGSGASSGSPDASSASSGGEHDAAGASGSAGTGVSAGASGSAGAGAGADASEAGTMTEGGATPSSGEGGASPGADMVPADYKGTPFTTLTIPGTIHAADYDRGGAAVAYCRMGASCTDGIVTGDWAPANTPPYRPPIPATAKVCSGAACDDNVGLCRMNPQKPDHTLTGQPVMPIDTYVCYSTAGEWTKYTVQVAEAGTYSVGGFMAVPMGGAVNLSFGAGITTGDIALPISPTTNCGCGENYHSWAERDALGTVTFPAAGTYLMTLTQVGRFNADTFIFTKP
jgi:hypothetical protein